MRRVTKFALLVGVRSYLDPTITTIPCCSKDVDDLYDALLDPKLTAYEPANITRIRDGLGEYYTPIENTIRNELRKLADKATSTDSLLFFFTGHGCETGGKSVLVAKDTYGSALADGGLELDEIRDILQSSKAAQKIIMIDACHSGESMAKAGTAPPGEAFHSALSNLARGLVVFSSCEKGQLSWTHGRNSLFTNFIVKGIRGEARRRDGCITLFSLAEYVGEQVENAARQMKPSRDQRPTLYNRTHARGFVLVESRPQMNSAVLSPRTSGLTFPMALFYGAHGAVYRPVVTVQLGSGNRAFRANASFDTGATANLAPFELTKYLATEPVDRGIRMTTAAGHAVRVGEVAVNVGLGAYVVRTTMLVAEGIHEVTLGIPFLEHFEVTLNFRQRTVTLRPLHKSRSSGA
jgi:hypothetical protein